MKTSEALRAAMALIEDESRWCRGVLARIDETPCGYRDPRANRRCALGALVATTGAIGPQNLLATVAEEHGMTITTLNDQRGHAAVMECYREAIRRAEAAEALP